MMKKNLLILMLLLITCSLSAQDLVKGKVTSGTDGQPIPGASVLVKGTTIGVVADINGDYSIKVSGAKTPVLEFSCIGYSPVEMPVNGKSIINVVMKEDTQQLQDVVVMGYSNKTKNEITSAVSVLSSDKLVDVTSNSIEGMLQGKATGVSVIKGSGQPGTAASVSIRGISSMNAPQGPLYVVDGIIGGSYDPNDVETVTILKDAGSTGMYGAQANGGVIVITTKKAKTEKMAINFKANVGFTTPDFDRQHLMNSQELYNYYHEYFRDPETYLIDDVAFNNSIPASVLNTDTDWRDLVFRTGVVQQYYVSLAGKSNNHSYYNSISYFNEKGTMKTTGYNQINVRSNNSYDITKWLSITSNLDVYSNISKAQDSNVMYYLSQAMPWDSPYNSDGSLKHFSTTTDKIWMRDKINPLFAFESDALANKNQTFGASYDFVANVKLTDWLTFTSQNRVSVSTNKYHYHRTSNVESMESGDLIEESQNLSIGGISTNMFNARKVFGKHTVSGLVGYEAQRDKYEILSASGKGLPYGLYVLDVTSNTPVVGGSNSTTGMQSLISQANYDYANKYFVTASFRIDQSSTFNKDNRTAMFPSISGSWIVSNEPFMANVKYISNLKLRTSWGKTGMKDIGASKFLESFSYSTQYNNQTAAVATQMANPDLKWEQTTQFNLGTSFTLFDRFDFDFNVYKNKTNDLLIYRDLPPSGGFDKQWQNYGAVVNKGAEFSLGAAIIKTDNLRWDANFSLSYNHNELTGFGGTEIFTTHYALQQIYKDGESLYTWHVKDYAGIDPQTGRKQYYDASGNKTYDYASARYVNHGSAMIPWQGGVGTTLTYGNWKFSATGNFVWGNTLAGRQRASSLALFVENSLTPSSDDVIWKQPGDNATIGIPAYATAQLQDTGMLVKGDYFKLRNVSLSYTFPKLLGTKNNLTLGISADNVFTLCNVWGADPEVSMDLNSGMLPGEITSGVKRYPNSRQFVFQVNLNF